MKNLDLMWKRNKQWLIREEGKPTRVREDAPKEVVESYNNYLRQIKDNPNAT